MERGGTRQVVLRHAEESALAIFRGLPTRVRLMITHLVAPSYSLGAVAVCVGPDGRALLVRSRQHRAWSLPGGLLKRRETPDAGVVRELAEEIGVTLREADLGRNPRVVVDARARQVTVVYEVTLPAEPVPDGVEVLEARWFAADELPPSVLRGTRESLALYDFLPR